MVDISTQTVLDRHEKSLSDLWNKFDVLLDTINKNQISQLEKQNDIYTELQVLKQGSKKNTDELTKEFSRITNFVMVITVFVITAIIGSILKGVLKF